MIKAVIFDMFETLVTLFEGKTYFSENVAEDLGLGTLLEEYRKYWHATENDRTLGKITFAQGIETSLRQLGQYTPQKVELVMSHRHAALQDTFSAIPKESVQLLQELKARGIKIGLMTNTFSDERDFIRACVLFPYFDVPLISYEIGICKPSQKMFSMMTERLGVTAADCLYVGDGGSRELYAAREAGMHPVQCTWFHELAFEPHVPCPILDDFDHAEKQMDVLKFI
ncbi:MAG: HAD-IA family hydrolase [Treponema sp.]|nr:HAD-IA family hydrolase [Treponema sp.]MBR5645199.1 HAD-IA family hydrolase [Treponema sp.]